MATSNNAVSDLKNALVDVQYNPTAMQRLSLQLLSDVTDNKIDIVDATNPFVFLMESAACMTSAACIKNEANTRRQYPAMAQTPEDLYRHMSDRDYVGRFATPSTTKISLMFAKEEILGKMVLDLSTGIRKIVIPRNTYFTVAGVVFSLQYPVEMRLLQHGGIQVLYNTDVLSPLQTLSTNFIDVEFRSSTANALNEFIFFEVDVQQFSIISQNETLNLVTEFRQAIDFTDQYYYTRVYVTDASNNWVEIATTHSQQIYDPNTVTAVLSVVNKTLNVSIPQIYMNSGLLTGRSVRTDVYQTKGALEMLLAEYPDSFTGNWLAIDKKDNDVYTAPMATLRTTIIYSDKIATGGANALTHDELRLRVIKNAIGSPTLPITNVQIGSALERKGYQVVTNIDNITNRVMLATKPMPDPNDSKLITAAASSIETVTLSMVDAVLNPTILDNGQSITLTPDTMYKTKNGITSVVAANEIQNLLQLPVASRAAIVTSGSYLYTPFHYVLDATGVEFESRPYYLDGPEIQTKLFVSENDTTLFQVGTLAYSIGRNASGYFIEITTQSGDTFKQLDDSAVFVQLAYVPMYEKDRAYLNGTLVGRTTTNERVYRFILDSTFNVDKNDGLELKPFSMYVPGAKYTQSSLKVDFDIIYSTSAPMTVAWTPGEVDTVVGRFLLPLQVTGVSHEKLRVLFGYSLKTLWAKARSMVSAKPYRTHDNDVPMLYAEDVFQRDANGSSISFDTNGHVVQVLLHAKNSPVLDSNGQPVMRFLKGDVMLDNNGDPIAVNERNIQRQIDILMIEGAYKFATDDSATRYRAKLTETIVGWLMQDLADISSKLLEQTRLYFYPKTTLGSINALVSSGVVKTVDAGQALIVKVYLSKINFNNLALRKKLSAFTVATIGAELAKKVVSVDAIEDALRAKYGEEVIAVSISGLGGNDNYDVMTIMDDADRFSIRKRLVALSDQSLIVEEDITISWEEHDPEAALANFLRAASI
jgi:hypothetical protein